MQNISSRAVSADKTGLKILGVLAAVLVLGIGGPPEGRSATWNGSTDGLWGTSANWTPAGVPLVDRHLLFPAGARLQSTNDLYGNWYSINVLSGGYKIYGNTLTVSNLIAGYPANTNSTVEANLSFDGYYFSNALHAMTIDVRTNGSELIIGGDVYLREGGVDIRGAGDLRISGTISGTNNIYKNSSGDLRFSGLGANTHGSNSYYCYTYVNTGTLHLNRYTLGPGPTFVGTVALSSGYAVIGSGISNAPVSASIVLDKDDQIGDTTCVRVNGTGQLDLNNHDDTIGFLEMKGGRVTTGTGTLTVLHAISVNAYNASGSIISGKLQLSPEDEAFFHPSGSVLKIDAVISGAAATTLNEGPTEGELILNGSNTYAGPTLVEGGTVTLMNDHALGSTANGTIITNGQIRLVDVSILRESLTVTNGGAPCLSSAGTSNFWSGDIALNENLEILAEEGSILVLSNVISGSHNITKTGPGVLKIMDRGAYRGATTVSNGVLQIDGSLSNSLVTVASGGTLTGEGTVKELTVLAGGIVNPGSSIGTLAVTGAVKLAGTLLVELNGTRSYDQLRADDVNLAREAQLSVSLSFNPPAGTVFKIIDKTSLGAVSGTFDGLPQGAILTVGGIPLRISYTLNDVTLTRVQGGAVTNGISQVSASSVRMRASGVMGYPYVIEAAPNLTEPIGWSPIATNIANSLGLIEFIEPDAGVYTQRFFRVLSP